MLESAKLRLHSPSASEGARLQALRLAQAWREDAVTWDAQPATVGTARTTWTAEGVVTWNVTSHVVAGASHGFLLKAAEEDAEAGVGIDFHGREKGEQPAGARAALRPRSPTGRRPRRPSRSRPPCAAARS